MDNVAIIDCVENFLLGITACVFFPGTLFLKLLPLVLVRPLDIQHIGVGLLSGYVDILYFDDDYRRSLTVLYTYVTALLLWPSAFALWGWLTALFYFIWAYATLILALCLLFAILGQLTVNLPLLAASKGLVAHVLGLLQDRVPLYLNNLVYRAVIILHKVWWFLFIQLPSLFEREAQEKFRYSDAPDFNPATQIRLLIIKRAVPLQRLQAELISCSLLEAPVYHAISYVWAHGPQDPRQIILHGKGFSIPQNVHDILRLSSSYFGPRIIWIDSICINQQGTVREKTLQVRQMQNIYTNAAHVLVCLGDSPTAGMAMGLAREIPTMSSLLGEANMPAYFASYLAMRNRDFILRDRIEALLDLWLHPWFDRAWVVQEVVVARQTTVFYGRHSIGLEDFYELLKPLLKGYVTSVLAEVLKLRSPAEDPLHSLVGMSKMYVLVGYRLEYRLLGPRRASHVLRLFSSRKATLDVDKVYSLFGMMESRETLSQLIDYGRSVEDVLLDLGYFLLEEGQALEVLDLAGIGWDRPNPTLPSWMVDWTIVRAGMALNPAPVFSSVRRYRAAGDTPGSMVRGLTRSQVLLRGLVLDRVGVMVPPINRDINSTQNGNNIWKQAGYMDAVTSLAQQHALDPYQYCKNQPLSEALWRTVIGDKTHTERPAPSLYGNVISKSFESMQQHARFRSKFEPGTWFTKVEEFRRDFSTVEAEEQQEINAQLQDIDFSFDTSKGSNHHTFCVTKRGYVGMVPELCRVGDLVCVLFGLETPFVLRPVENGPGQKTEVYRLVGDAYMHGIMDGEALNLGLDHQDFTLV